MKENISTHRFFNLGTQRALYENTDSYVDKEIQVLDRIRKKQKKYGFENAIRMDLGENSDGCDLKVLKIVEDEILKPNKRSYLKNYPDFSCVDLRKDIGKLHGIPADWVVLSAGLDQMLSMIAAAFLELNDRILIPSPTFFLFEEYSKKMGAIPVELPLRSEDSFAWTRKTLDSYKEMISKLHPKLIWIANPNNPTGKVIPDAWWGEIIAAANDNFAFIVFDEAYGEYSDPSGGVNSASKFLGKSNNLIVLRSFSKAYGLANLRIGYAMVNNHDIMRALMVHRPYYPITQMSFDFAKIALNRIDYLDEVRNTVATRKQRLNELVADNAAVQIIESDTSIFMLSHKRYTAASLSEKLAEDGIFVSNIPGRSVASRKYVRITLSNEENLIKLTQSLARIS